MTGRWERLTPLTGLLAVALAVVAILAIGGNTPDTKDSADTIFAYYRQHHDQQMGAAFVLALGAALLIFFAGTLRAVLARPPARGQLAATAFGGGIIASAGFLLSATIHMALADSGRHASAAGAQALAVLDDNDFLPFAFGIGVMVLAAGISITRTRTLPVWLGWVAVVGGIVTFTPLGFFGLILCLVWIIVVSVLLTVRPPLPPAATTPTTAPAAG
jgi:hypothetical protein